MDWKEFLHSFRELTSIAKPARAGLAFLHVERPIDSREVAERDIVAGVRKVQKVVAERGSSFRPGTFRAVSIHKSMIVNYMGSM